MDCTQFLFSLSILFSQIFPWFLFVLFSNKIIINQLTLREKYYNIDLDSKLSFCSGELSMFATQLWQWKSSSNSIRMLILKVCIRTLKIFLSGIFDFVVTFEPSFQPIVSHSSIVLCPKKSRLSIRSFHSHNFIGTDTTYMILYTFSK